MNRKLTAIILLLMLVATGLKAQVAATGQAYAEVIEALAANENIQLNFGKFSPEVSGGQIVLTPDNVRTVQGSVILGGGVATAGKFIITGAPEANYSIQLPAASVILKHETSNSTMVINGWTSIPPAGTGTGTLIGGTETVKIGATLSVGSLEDNPVGRYTGSYSLTFAYN